MGETMQRAGTAITRRAAVGAAAGSLAIAALPAHAAESAGCRIGPPPHAKGPLVFMDYDQVELDAAYNQGAYAPMRDQITKRFTTNSAEIRRRLGAPRRVAYGPTEIEKLDIFRTDQPKAPIFIFVHGGAWLRGAAQDYAFPAEMFVKAGAHYLPIDFIQVNDAGGDIRKMSEQVNRAVGWVYKNAASFGGDPDRIYIGGQSSGAHLTGVALTSDWPKLGLPQNILKGGLLQSGMYEMKPVRLSSRGTYVHFDDAMEEAMSSIRHLDKLHAPVTVMYGTNETPEFQRQNRDFAAAVMAAGKPARLVVLPNHNHYEVQETLANPYGWGGRAALALMGLGAP